jgi:hypothetical protein
LLLRGAATVHNAAAALGCDLVATIESGLVSKRQHTLGSHDGVLKDGKKVALDERLGVEREQLLRVPLAQGQELDPALPSSPLEQPVVVHKRALALAHQAILDHG